MNARISAQADHGRHRSSVSSETIASRLRFTVRTVDHGGGMIALVAGATRGGGHGIAVALGEAGHTVYVTGRSTRAQRSEIDRPETIEETAELVEAAGGTAIAVRVDHSEPQQVR